MKLLLTQLNAILKPCFFIHSKSKQAVCMLFCFFGMLSLNTAWAQGDCPEGEPLQWEWMQDLIASSNGCDIEAIGQFEYEGDTYFRTLKSGCLAENDLLFFNCMGDKVCADSDDYVHNQCNQSIVSASVDITNIIWSYEDTSEICPEGNPLDRAWMQRLIISSNGCNIESIVQFEYKGKPYYRTTSSGCLSTNKYLYYNCDGEEVCVDPETGYAFKKCDEKIISANTNNATTIWTYEEPCPEGDPLQWNWIQPLINNSEECYIEAIIQFEYNGNTFFRTARTNCLLYKRYSFFNCQGQEICVDVTYSTSEQCDDEIISASVDNGNIIWTYEDLSPPLNCLEGDPLQWDWVQTLIAGSNGCNVEAIGQFEFEGNTYYRTLDYGCLARNKYLLFNCEGEEVCFDYSSYYNRCNQEIVSASADITSLIWSYEDLNVICPEGDPLEWDWIQDLIAQSNGCNIAAIGQFEKEGNTYFHTLGAGCFENNKFLFFNCKGEEICIDEKIDSYNNCGEETLFASTNSTIIWAYEDTCPEGDPLEWDWIQDLIASSDGCNIEAIIQFEFNDNTFFRTARVDCLIDQKYLYFNCEGEKLCKETYYEQCGAEIFSISTDNGNIIWTYEDLTPPVSCPEGDPLEWEWMQELIATSSGCNIGAIHQFEFEGNTYYRTADKEFSCFPSNNTYRFYNCGGEEVCTDPRTGSSPGYSTRCLEEVILASEDYTAIWTYEDPYPNQTCPPGEPLEWDWIQDLIASAHECVIGVIHQFDYNGATYFRVGDGQYCGIADFSTNYYNCKGELECRDAMIYSSFSCDEEFRRAGWSGTNIWIYEPPIAQTCPEGDPLEWDWIQEITESGYGCAGYQIRQIDYDGNIVIQLAAGECHSNQNFFYDCKENLICWEAYSTAPGTQCEQIIAASNNATTLWAYEAACSLPLDVGTCNDNIPRYYFDGEENRCRLFSYRGCGGNANNFETYGDCLNACNPIISCPTGDILGCTDPTAVNYNASANCDDSSCEYENTLIAGEYNYALCNTSLEHINLNTMCNQGTFKIVENTSNTTATIDAAGNLVIDSKLEVEGYIKVQSNSCSGEWIFNLSNAQQLNSRLCFFLGYDNIILHYPWLSHIINPSSCNNEAIITYGLTIEDVSISGHYVYVISDIGSVLYTYDGKVICSDYENGTNTCTELYNLIHPENSWVCSDNTQILGCIYPNACNYLPTATIYDRSCDYTCIPIYNIDYPDNSSTYVCAPVTTAPLTLQDFVATEDPEILNELSMEVEEIVEIQQYYSTITYNYTFTEDGSNDKAYRQTVNYVANQFLQAPEVVQPGTICEEDLWSYIKIGADQYKIYADDNGSIGDEISICNTSNLICSTANFGVDTKVPNQYSFWATTYFEFPDGTICESEAMPFSVDVQAKPVAALSSQNKTMNIGEGLSLMDVVTDNKSGYWSGENIIYLMTATGENIAYFSANEVGVYKLYYTVKNDNCVRSYLLVVEVSSAGKAAATQASYKTMDITFNMYPNPTSNKVFIDLSGEAIYQINLMDISGKIIKQIKTKLDATSAEIEVSDLPKGMYLVELKNEETQTMLNTQNTQKLIIE